MTEETHVSKTIGPFIYQWELGVKTYKFAKDKGWIDWVKNKFSGKVTQNTSEETVKEVSQENPTPPAGDV